MTRVASLYLPQLPIERLRRLERPARPLEPRAQSAPILPPVDDEPGACSVPRGGGWRPGARWAQDTAPTKAQLIAQVAQLPAHKRPPMRMLGRRSEHVSHPFRAMPSDEAGGGNVAAPLPPRRWDRPTILIDRVGQREVITAACPIAISLELLPGMAASHARAMIADLDVRDADASADRALLDRLALHAVAHWTPTASVATPDGLWLDLTGTTHLFGGEERFCRRLLRFLDRLGLTAHVAVAGTPGAAHALARFGGHRITVLNERGEAAALAELPVGALRLSPDALTSAANFGLEQIGDLIKLPRAPLAKRLGLATVTRLDQALGHVAEPVIPVVPFDAPSATRHLLEPIGTPESIEQVIRDLVDDLIEVLRKRALGVRKAILSADRVDGETQRIAIGASRATRDARHLARMFLLKLDRIDPGLGIEAMYIEVPHSEPLSASSAGSLLGSERQSGDLAPAIDQLTGRAGEDAVFKIAPNESDVPERAVCRVSPLNEPGSWPQWKRPARLLRRPQHLSHVVALLPDQAPRRFTWRGQLYQVIAGDGPERIHGEWWRNDQELWAVRDYFVVEVESGERFWVFRRGDGVEPDTGNLSWFIHGVFG